MAAWLEDRAILVCLLANATLFLELHSYWNFQKSFLFCQKECAWSDNVIVRCLIITFLFALMAYFGEIFKLFEWFSYSRKCFASKAFISFFRRGFLTVFLIWKRTSVWITAMAFCWEKNNQMLLWAFKIDEIVVSGKLMKNIKNNILKN